MMDDRLDALYAQLVRSDAYQAGDPRVVDVCRKIEADRARLHGLHHTREGGQLAEAIAALVREPKVVEAGDGEAESSKGRGALEGGTPKTR